MQFISGMSRKSYPAFLYRMLVLTMTSFLADEIPAVRFDEADHVAYFHAYRKAVTPELCMCSANPIVDPLPSRGSV